MTQKKNMFTDLNVLFPTIVFILTLFWMFYEALNKSENTIFDAAIYGQSDLIKEYVNQGKDMDLQDEFGATLLHYSLQSGHSEISKFLVISEADVNIIDNEGLTPLDWAHWMNQVGTAKLIREYGGKTRAELNQ